MISRNWIIATLLLACVPLVVSSLYLLHVLITL